MTTVLVTTRSFGTGEFDARGALAAAGYEVVTAPADHRLPEMASVLSRCDAWIAGTGPVRVEHLMMAPNLRVIARYGVGTDAVDLQAAMDRGIIVTVTPGANSEAVADHTLALLLAALRGVVAGDRRVRLGQWTVERTREVASLRVGLVGVGRIGSGVARRLRGFGATIFGVDPNVSDDELRARGVEPGGDVIPRDVDVVSLHAPGHTRVVDEAWLSNARSGLILVNTARAALVDEVAVATSLRSGRLGMYATDVLASESGELGGPLLEPDLAGRVVITPHSGAQTVEAVDRMGALAVEAVIDVLGGREPRYRVVGKGVL